MLAISKLEEYAMTCNLIFITSLFNIFSQKYIFHLFGLIVHIVTFINMILIEHINI